MKKKPDRYRVEIACRNDITGKSYLPGDIITTDDFSQDTIDHWRRMIPPVVRRIAHGGDD